MLQIAGLKSRVAYMEKDLEMTSAKLEDALRAYKAEQKELDALNGMMRCP